jgi:hypothetical protein
VQASHSSGFGNVFGMIDRSGSFVVEPQYDIIRPFRGAALTGVSRAGRFGAIDRTGREVIPLRFGESEPLRQTASPRRPRTAATAGTGTGAISIIAGAL